MAKVRCQISISLDGFVAGPGQSVDDPLGELLSRYARTHGPFTTQDAAARFGLGLRVTADVLGRLAIDGRLIRGDGDKGCFVILEPATPSRLLSAFPPDAPVKRCGLAETIGDIRAFLAETA